MNNRHIKSNIIFIVVWTICFLLLLSSCGMQIKSNNQDESEITHAKDNIQVNSEEGASNAINAEKVTFQDIIDTIGKSISDNSNNCSVGDDIILSLELSNIKQGYVDLGYLFVDIDNDGEEELLIGTNATEKFDDWAGSIYMIFATVDNNVIQVVNGSSRNCYYVCEDGTVANISFCDGFSIGYSFFEYRAGKLNLIESVIRIVSGLGDTAETIWLYSDSYTYEEIYDIEKFDIIDEEKANMIREKYIFTYPQFTPLNHKE